MPQPSHFQSFLATCAAKMAFSKEGRPHGRLGGEDSAKHSAIAVPDERRKAFGGRQEQTLAFAVENAFPAPPSPGNAAAFQKAGLLPAKNDSFLTV